MEFDCNCGPGGKRYQGRSIFVKLLKVTDLLTKERKAKRFHILTRSGLKRKLLYGPER